MARCGGVGVGGGGGGGGGGERPHLVLSRKRFYAGDFASDSVSSSGGPDVNLGVVLQALGKKHTKQMVTPNEWRSRKSRPV